MRQACLTMAMAHCRFSFWPRTEAAALNFIRDAYAHLKIIGFTASSMPLLEMAGIKVDDGVIELDRSGGATA